MFSKRIDSISLSSIVKYNKLVKQREKEGIVFIKANIGQPDFKTDRRYYKALNSIDNITNGYSSACGIKTLRHAVSKYYNNNQNTNRFSIKDIVITQGASDAIIKILYTICDSGDDVIVLEPFFSDYKIYAQIVGINLIPVSYHNFSFKSLQKKITSKTKAILFANPNNPDGEVLDHHDIVNLIDFAKQNNLFIISDEVYSGFIYNSEFFSLSSYDYNNIIIVDSASKKLNSCGSRIGYVISKNNDLLKRIIILNDSKISISNVEQYAVSEMLINYDEIIKYECQIYKRRLIQIEQLLNKYKIKYIVPKGGISLLVELPIQDSDDYVYWLVKKYENRGKSLLLTSAKEFYIGNEGYNKVRLTLTIPDNQIPEVINLMVDSIKKYNGG